MTPQIDLTTWYRPKIDRKALKALSKRSDWAGIRHVTIYFSALLLSGYLAYRTWGTGWTVLWFLIYGNIWAFSNAIWHETNHGTFFKSQTLNKIFWYIGSYMAAFEPIRWKWSHYHHHSYTMHTINPIDVEVQITRPVDVLGFFTRLLPLGGVIHLHRSLLFFYREVFLHSLGIRMGHLLHIIPDEEWRLVIRWSRIHLAISLGAILASILTGSWLPALFIALPNFYGNTLASLCGLTQHAGLEENGYDHRTSTRTVILGPILSFLYCHMEYHIEHHIFPMVPCHNLSKLRALIEDQLPEASLGIAGAYKEIIPAVMRQARDEDYFLSIELPA
jgi:fatty acid desaturase